jgi:HlyD family secretion protein
MATEGVVAPLPEFGAVEPDPDARYGPNAGDGAGERREAARLEGERGQSISKSPRPVKKISQVDQDMRAEMGKDLCEIRGKISELLERSISAQDQLKRVDIKSPLDGVVHQSSVHTGGGGVTQGEQLMLVVPEADARFLAC